MTMRISIKNEDAARTAKVAVEDFTENRDALPSGIPPVAIGPGQSHEVWIHSTRRVVVEEEGMVQRPAPPPEPPQQPGD